MLGRLSVARRAARATVSRFHTAAKTREASQFTMPALSPTMTEGGIARWEKKEGEAFAAGDLLLQIETDKAQMDVEAQDDGILVKILAPEGAQGVRVNSPIAIVAEDGDDLASIDVAALSKPKEAAAEAEAKPKEAEAKPKEAEAKPKEAEKPAAKKADEVAQLHEADRSASGVLAPAAAFAVHANHIANAGEIQGTGPKGRVLKGDVLKFLRDGKAVISKEQQQQQSASTAASTPAAAKKPSASASAAPASADAETAFLVQSLESSVLRRIGELELAKKTTVVQVPFDRLSALLKGNRALSIEAFALRAAALAAQQVKVAKDGGAQVGVAVEASRAPAVVEVTDAATTGIAGLAEAIRTARKDGQPTAAAGGPAVVLAAEGLYSPATLPKDATVVVVGGPRVAVSQGEAAGALDWALDQLVGGNAASAKQPRAERKQQSVVDVSVIGESPAVPAFAAKIKAFLANPELLTF
ncbi:hypothetical protein LPJ53_004045 [Coemansia erecta]|uniref:Dihydrolipoamide acetyltransferase component of pyruvate dehydrogenase complex n=1 Tax=Coemansia erecta TaxID=147472 RepID=A0A9W8CS41_9FUNG|nr:hypothetical protein LPJ53_004045 [Coemansia erecta]